METSALVVGPEEVCPTTGRAHYHGYVTFPNPRTLRGLAVQFPKAYFQERFGTEAEARQYACKQGEAIVDRVEPLVVGVNDAKKKGEVELEVHRRLKEGESIRAVWADHPIYCARNMRMLRAVVRVYESWGHRDDGLSLDNLSGIEL